ncbi:MAG: NfeD family protein [Planctomycetota bacterium]|nr:NfeD family protein [Planctomycetota bacterium]
MQPTFVSILLVMAGFACIFLELVIPSAGLIALISGSLLISGIVVGYSAGFVTGTTLLGVTLVGVPVVVMYLLQIWPNTPIGRRLFSRLPSRDEVEPDRDIVDSLQGLVGRQGVARSKLLPAGSVTIDGKHYDAVSDGLPIEIEQKVTVVAIKAQRIFVRPLVAASTDTTVDTLSQSIESLGLDDLEDPLDS